MIAPEDRTVHSNMPEIVNANNIESDDFIDAMTKDQVQPGLKLVSFQKSPIMSTYLVALVVGEFESREDQTKDGIKIRAFTPKGKLDQGDFALVASKRALEYYTEFFDVKYPLPKYDCIAIPDFQCGAMENWGLVTYR